MDSNRPRLTTKELEIIRKNADSARAAILSMTTLAGSGHPGGSMSTIDFLMTLLQLININPRHPEWELRDRVIYSHGHISPAVYSALASRGYFGLDEAIAGFRLAGSRYEGHVEPVVPGVEWATGNLGQGLSAACGIALACRMKKIANHIFILMGDGEQQKGQLSEARRFAVKYKLNNLIGFCDYNRLQISGDIGRIMPQHIMDNYLADGWDVVEADGHDLEDLQEAIFTAVENDAPTLILAETVMGKGVSFMENQAAYHGAALTEDKLKAALAELGRDNRLAEYKVLRQNYQETIVQSRAPFTPLLNIGSHHLYTEKTDNRSAWGKALADLAELNPESLIAVFDCDLKASVKTGEFEKISPARFFQSGIMEHHTAVAAGAMSREDVLVFFADFGVFGVDETYNQQRLNDINHTNLKLITTHVGLDVGEDGKTHQCIDYLGLMRNLYHFRTIVPGDPNQTDHIIRYVTNEPGNFFVPMGRSKIGILRDRSGKIIYDQDYKFEFGKADLLRPGQEAALLSTGTLVNLAVELADRLLAEGINLQVWNISCPFALDPEAIRQAAVTGAIFTLEDHNVHTGLGSCVADYLCTNGLNCRLRKFGVEDYASSGSSADVFKAAGLDPDTLSVEIRDSLLNRKI
ncbi:MAG: transketolase [Candidatus Cloacimonetes bacterium]|nr:transketolase [Candidatus Cloacimonadota bacterium]